MTKSVLGVTLSTLIGLLAFFVLLIIANNLPITNSTYASVISFLNANLGLIILFTVLLYLGELFFIFIFPLNLPAPIFNAFGGVFLIEFILRIIYLLGDILNQNLLSWVENYGFLIYLVVFLIILISGYVNIFLDVRERRYRRRRYIEEERARKKREEERREEQRRFEVTEAQKRYERQKMNGGTKTTRIKKTRRKIRRS